MKNLYDNEMEVKFLSKSNNESFSRIVVAAFAAQLDPTIEELSDIKTAISEAVTNSIIHGYENSEGIVKINCKIENRTLTIEVSDYRKGHRKYRNCKTAAVYNKAGFGTLWNGIYYNGKFYG